MLTPQAAALQDPRRYLPLRYSTEFMLWLVSVEGNTASKQQVSIQQAFVKLRSFKSLSNHSN